MRNERGYTLVITLLMITLIFVVGVTLIASSVNSANQNKQTGAKYIRTHLAEMGVDYVDEKLKNDFKPSIFSSIGDLENGLESFVRNIPRKKVDTSPERYFEIKFAKIEKVTVPADSPNLIRRVHFISQGYDELGKKEELKAQVSVVVPLGGVVIPEEGDVVIEEDASFSDNIKNNTTFSSTATLSNINIIQNSTLKATNLISKGKLHMNQDTKLNVCQNAEFEETQFSGRSSHNSEVQANICGNAKFNKGASLQGNSSLIVGGNLIFYGELASKSSKIIVSGDFEFNGSLKHEPLVCVKGNISGISYKTKSHATTCSPDQLGESSGVFYTPNLTDNYFFECRDEEHGFCTPGSSFGEPFVDIQNVEY